ncbi:MAG: C25 family cysteine peptidase, partial [Deltaproteobacteria bacterium]|nr:C25 family cysteine peptidase [Deltaproteobacteria bacterium]
MRLQEKYADFWKAQDLREKLKKKNEAPSFASRPKAAPQAQRSSSPEDSGTLLEARRAGPRANVSLSSVDDRNETPAGRKISAPLSDKPLKKSPEVQQALAGSPAMKLLVKEEGWYRVSQPELAAAGMNTNFNPKHLHLYVDGNELPIRVIAEKDNKFGPRDAIEFYGIGLDTPSTDTQVYWLVVGSRPGKRMPVSRGQGGQASLTAFPYTAESKERSFYFPALLNGEESNFFGPIIYTYRVDQLLYVWDADPTSPEDALLEVALQGGTAGPHRVKVFFNDSEVGEVSFSGQSQAMFRAEIPVSALQAGENLVSFIAQGGEMDISLLDYIHLTYWRAYRAHENGLKLTGQGGRLVSVGGFSHPQVQVVDITDPQSVIEVEGKVKAQGSGYAITFRVPGSGPRTLLALAAEKAKSPAQLVLNQPSNWHQGMRGYALVIISHKDFLESLKPLKTLREAQGLSVALVDVEDVYDEFSFGAKTPQAIKDFLQRAKSSWQKPPRFVLLVGDASYDPRNFLGYGDLDFVPTKLLDTAYLETASDDWFVDLNGDGLPDMALGRLPVQTPQEASAMVAKIIAYEKSSRTSEVLLGADKTEKTADFDFVEAAQKVGALFPSSVGLRKVFRGEFGSDGQAKEALLHYLGQGSLLVNYLGHGGMMEWRGDLFTADDAEALANGGGLAFFINMTCLNGFFQAPY